MKKNARKSARKAQKETETTHEATARLTPIFDAKSPMGLDNLSAGAQSLLRYTEHGIFPLPEDIKSSLIKDGDFEEIKLVIREGIRRYSEKIQQPESVLPASARARR